MRNGRDYCLITNTKNTLNLDKLFNPTVEVHPSLKTVETREDVKPRVTSRNISRLLLI